MSKIFGTRFARRDRTGIEYEYELEIDFKDQAVMDNRLETEVIAKRRPTGTTEWQKITATVQYEHERHEIRIEIQGGEFLRIDTSNFDSAIQAGLDVAIEQVEQVFSELTGVSIAHSVETLIQYIPLPDPVFGCLLKAGLSTVVGQLAKCIYSTREIRERRIRATFRCLGDHGMDMLSTAARRTLWCMIRLGI